MRFVGLLVAGFWLFVGSPAGAAEAGPAGSVGGQVNPVVESYARDYVVPYGEAERRLDRVGVLQEVMASIRALEPDRLAGWGIDHGEDFGAWVWLTGDTDPGAAAAGLAAAYGDVEIRTGAVHTYAELRAAQDRFDPDAIGKAMGDSEAGSRVAGMVVLTGVDMGSNSVRVSIDPAGVPGRVRRGAGDEPSVVSDETFEAAAAWLTGIVQDYLGVGVKVTDGRGFSLHSDLRGGEAMSSCMAGFAAKDRRGNYGFISAGHCGDEVTLQGVSLSMEVRDRFRLARNTDAELYRFPHGGAVHSLTDDYKCYYDDRSVCDVTGTIERAEMMGDYVCHNLVIGEMSCGEVTDISAQDYKKSCKNDYGDSVPCGPVFVRVEGDSLKFCRGDSGGPWYDQTGIAYGIHSGGAATTENCVPTGERWAVFSAIKDVEAVLDVKVLTEDPSPSLSAVRNLRVLAGRHSVSLNWDAPAGGAGSYTVYRRIAKPGEKYTKVSAYQETLFTDHSRFLDEPVDLIPSVEYEYKVVAHNNLGMSSDSRSIRVVAPVSVEVVVRDTDSVKIDWWYPYHDVARYDVYRRVAKPGHSYTKIGTVRSTDSNPRLSRKSFRHPASDLTPGIEYYYRVEPVSKTGVVLNGGPDSGNYTRFMISAAESAIEGLRTKGFSDGVRVSWDVPVWDVASYKVYRRVAKPGESYVEVADRKVPYLWDPFSGLTPGVEYYYRVKAVSSTGVVGSWGPGDNYVSWGKNSTSSVIPAVSGLRTKGFSNGVTVSWDVSVWDVASYKVYRRVAKPGESYVEVADRKVPYLWDPFSGLTPGVEYYYRVKAVSSTGVVGSWGPGDNYVSWGKNSTSSVIPAVSGLRTKGFSNGVTVFWDVPVGDVASYKVYRRVAKPGESYVEVADRKVPYLWDPYSSLKQGTEYYYRVKPVSKSGFVGSWGPGNNYVSLRVP